MALTEEFLNFLSEEEQRKAGVQSQKPKEEETVEALPNYIQEPPKVQDDSVSNNMHEFVGQTVWGFLDSAAWGTLEVGETLTEATGLTEKNALENKLALGAAGDWEDLTGMGKAGFVIGSGLGMLPTFGWTGKALSATNKLAKIGAKSLAKGNEKKIAKYLIDDIANNSIAKSIVGDGTTELSALGNEVVEKIVHEGSKLNHISNGFFNPLKGGYQTLSDEAIELASKGLSADKAAEITVKGLQANIKNVLETSAGGSIKASEQEIADIAGKVYQVIRTENPTNIRHSIKALFGDAIPEKAADLISAYATDALLVGFHGGMAALSQNAVKLGANNVIDAKADIDGFGKIAHDMLDHGFWGGFIGLARFIPGGKGSKIVSEDIKGMISRVNKSFPKLASMSHAQKVTATKLLYSAAEGDSRILQKLNIAEKGFDINNVGKMTTTQLNSILQKARDVFPGELNKLIRSEIGRDVMGSMGRMLAGSAAMNAPNIYQVVKSGNFSDAANLLGTEPEEIMANLLVGMVFSKRGEKFGNKNKYFDQLSESNRHYAENIDTIRKMEEGLAAVDMLPEGLDLIRKLGMEGGENLGGVVKGQISSDPYIKDAIDIISSSIGVNKTIGEKLNGLGDNANTFKNLVIDKRLAIDADKSLNADQRIELNEQLDKAVGMYDVLLSRAKVYSIDKISEVPIESGDFDLMIERLSKAKVGDSVADTPTALKELLDNRANEVYSAETTASVATKMEFLASTFENLGIKTSYDSKTGKMTVSNQVLNNLTDVLNMGEYGRMQTNIIRLIEQAKNAGLLHGDESGVNNLAAPSKKQVNEIKSLFDDANNKINTSIHGEGYLQEGNHTPANMDVAMSSEAGWAAYHTHQQMNQPKKLEFLLTGKGDNHGVDINQAKQVREDILRHLANKEITWEAGDKQADEVADLKVFSENLNKYLSYYIPSSGPKEKLSKSMDVLVQIKDQITPLVGDIFSDQRNFNRAMNLAVSSFSKRLGGEALNKRTDIKRALVELVINNDFGSLDPNSNVITLPHPINVLSELNRVYKKGNPAIEDHMVFYEKIKEAIDSVNPGGAIVFAELSRHKTAKSWVTSLENAKRASDTYAFEIVNSTQKGTVGDLHHMMTSIGKAKQREYELNKTESEKRDEKFDIRKELKYIKPLDPTASNKLEALLQENLATHQLLKDRYDAAVESGHYATLHALAKEQHHLKSILEQVHSKRLNIAMDGPLLKMHSDILAGVIKQMYNATDIKAFDLMFKDKAESISIERISSRTSGNNPRITPSQFTSKYGISKDFIDSLNKLASVDYDPSNPMNVKDILSLDRIFFGSSGEKMLGLPNLTSSNGDARQFVEPWAMHLRDMLKDKKTINNDDTIEVPTKEAAIIDVRQIFTDQLLNSRRAKVLEYNDGVGSVSHMMLTNWVNKGITGLFDNFNLWDKAYVLKDGGVVNGKTKSSFGSRDLVEVDKIIEGEGFSLEVQNKAGYLSKGEKIDMDGTLPGKYIRVAIDESTNIVIRFDKEAKRRIKESLGVGTALRNTLEGLVGHTPGYKRFIKTLDGNSILKDAEAKQIILHARLMSAFPHKIKEMYESNDLWSGHSGVSYDSVAALGIWKRLKMEQTKNGIVPTPVFVKNAMDVMKTLPNSQLFNNVLDSMSKFIKPDGTGTIKVATIDELGNITADPLKIGNKYNIYDRYSDYARTMFKDGRITEVMMNEAIDKVEGKSKELTDAASYVTLDPMIAFAGIMGARAEHFTYGADGNINGVKFALKPSVAHSAVLKNGGHEVYYNKTAFHYDPIMAEVLQGMGVDMLTFKSANKVNSFSADQSMGTDRYLIDKASNSRDAFFGDMQLTDKNGVNFNHKNSDHVVDLPFESIMLRNLAQDHLPALSQSMGVHGNHNNGLYEWAGIQTRMETARNMWADILNNPYKATEIAKLTSKVLSADGDMRALDTGLEYFLAKGGLGNATWLIPQLEKNMVQYYLNGGSIATAEATSGNHNVMIPEYGNLMQPFHHRDRQYIYGESIPSFIEGNQQLSLFGARDGSIKEVGSFIIKKETRRGWEGKKVDPWDTQAADSAIPSTAEYVIYMKGSEAQVMVEGYVIHPNGRLESKNGVTVDSRLNGRADMKERALHRESLVQELDGLKKLKGGDKMTYAEAMEAIVREDILGISGERISDASNKGLEYTVGEIVAQNVKYQYAGGQDLYVAYNNNTGKYQIVRKANDLQAKPGKEWVPETDVEGLFNAQNALRNMQLTKSSRWLGANDLRMPSNGTDNVITKSRGEFNMSKATGEITFSATNAESMGPVKKMNHTDADRKQDADNDFDKSASYTAVHGKFLENVLGTAGHEQLSGEMTPDMLRDLTKSIQMDMDLTDPGTMKRVADAMSDVNAFRGRVVKAHQTITYLVNAFGGYAGVDRSPSLATIHISQKKGSADLKLRNSGEITQNKTFVRGLVKKFLDYYKDTPQGVDSYDQTSKIMNEIFFGKEGLFELQLNSIDYKTTDVDAIKSKFEDSGSFLDQKKAIMQNIIDPLNRYISLNKGEVPGTNNVAVKATLADFAGGYSSVMQALVRTPKVKMNITDMREGSLRSTQGAERLWDYITNDSQTPFDKGMKALSDIHNSRPQNRSMNSSEVSDIIRSARDSSFDADGIRDLMAGNKINKVLNYYVKNQAKVIELGELHNIISGFEKELSSIRSYNQNRYGDMPEYTKLLDKVNALKSAAADISAVLSNLDVESTFPIKMGQKKEGEYINNSKNPIVVYEKIGTKRQVSEVIHPNNRNKNFISDRHIGLMNGRKFVHVDGAVQRDAKASFNAYGGIARDSKGVTISLTEKMYVGTKVRQFKAQAMESNGTYPSGYEMTKGQFRDRSTETEALLHDQLSSLTTDMQRRQFLFDLLTPRLDTESVAITSFSNIPGTHTSFDYAFKPNYWASTVYKYLTGRATESRFNDSNMGMNKHQAGDMIELLAKMHTQEYMRLYDPSFHITNQSKEYSTKKASRSEQDVLEGKINEGFLERVTSEKLHGSEIVNNFMDWITGKRQMTPTELEILTNKFVEKGFLPEDLYINRRFVIDRQGNKQPYGDVQMGQTIEGYKKFSGANRFGNPGTTMKQSSTDFIKEQIKNRNCK